MSQTNEIISASEAIAMSQERAKTRAESVLAGRVNEAVRLAVENDMNRAVVPLRKTELALAMHATELLRKKGFRNVQFARKSTGEWDGEIMFEWGDP